MSVLPQLRESLLRAAERGADTTAVTAVTAERSTQPSRRVLARRGSLALAVLAALLMLAAVAYATTQLISTGSPVKSEEPFTPDAGAGVAIPRSDGLLGIAAADPAGGPPWTMRVYDTSRGLGCVEIGRLVEGHIGVLGQDGAFGDDGRFHRLPTQVSQAQGDCVLLDARGHAFLGVAAYGTPASGLPHECQLLHGSRAAKERCARSDPRDVFYGLLGPDARAITYTLNGHTRTIPTVGDDGAYLIVEHTPAWITRLGIGGGSSGTIVAEGGSLDGRPLPQPVELVHYTHGRTCRILQFRTSNGHGGHCEPPAGYAPRPVAVPSAAAIASPISLSTTLAAAPPHEPGGTRQLELVVSFTARAAVTSAFSGYSVSITPPRSGHCSAGNIGGAAATLGRNVRAGETVHLTVYSGFADSHSLFPACPGIAHGIVTYEAPAVEAFLGAGPYHGTHRVTVGRFTYDAPR